MSSFELGGLSLEVEDYEFPPDVDTGSWLRVRAVLTAKGTRVEANGPFLQAADIQRFALELQVVSESLAGEAELSSLEPDLKLTARGDGMGHITVTTELTPDHLRQSHRVEAVVDQTHLPAALKGLDAIMERFPVRRFRD